MRKKQCVVYTIGLLFSAVLAWVVLSSCPIESPYLEKIREQMNADMQTPGAVNPPAAPSDLQAAAVSTTQIDLTWTDNSDNEDEFQIQRKKAGTEDWQTETVGADSTTFSDKELDPETEYVYRVRAVNSGGSSEWSEIIKQTTFVVPTYTVAYDGMGADSGTVPVDNNIYAEGETVIISGKGTMSKTGYTFIGWKSESDGSGTMYNEGSQFIMRSEDVVFYAQWTSSAYILNVTTDNGGTVTVPSTSSIDVGHGIPTEITAVPDSGFSFDVWTVTAGAASIEDVNAASTTVTLENGDATVNAAFVDSQVPAKPVIQGVTDNTVTNQDVMFTISNVEDGALVEYTINGGTDWLSYGGEVTIAKKTNSVDNYSLAARQTDAASNTSPVDAGDYISVTIDTVQPGAPIVENVSTSPTIDTTPTWDWNSGSGDGNGTFRYQLNTEGWSGETIATDFTAGSILSEGTNYLYVQERDDAGNWSSSGSEAIEISIIPPANPVSPSDNGSSSSFGGIEIKVKWDSVPEAAAYEVQVSENADCSSPILSDTVTGTTAYDNHECTLGDTYYWRVRTKNEDNQWGSSWSDIWEFTAEHKLYQTGDIGPAGGIIIFDEENYFGTLPGNARYLEAAPADARSDSVWSNITSTLLGTTGDALGDGQSNTIEIMGQLGHLYSAAEDCEDYSVSNNGQNYNDWFLPSKDELFWMYLTFDSNGITPPGAVYWSSTEKDGLGAWGHLFSDLNQSFPEPNDAGDQDGLPKGGLDPMFGVDIHVRAVRSF